MNEILDGYLHNPLDPLEPSPTTLDLRPTSPSTHNPSTHNPLDQQQQNIYISLDGKQIAGKVAGHSPKMEKGCRTGRSSNQIFLLQVGLIYLGKFPKLPRSKVPLFRELQGTMIWGPLQAVKSIISLLSTKLLRGHYSISGGGGGELDYLTAHNFNTAL